MISIHALSSRPDLLDIAATWSWQQWGASAGRSLESVRERGARYRDLAAHDQCFVLLEDDTPAAMASFSATDLDARPDLFPWLAGVHVDPAFRGRGHAIRVVQHADGVDGFCADRDAAWGFYYYAEGFLRKEGLLF
jgi:GNAT superfamily N-acetyltransferase